tara:strand:- start:80 stop:706 length:627 start_codon:yes stop_codon:yes gene_type:complete
MPPYGIAQFYDQVYNDDPFNINRRDSEIIIGADGKAKTIPILPMTSDEIMAGSIVPPDFNAGRFQSIFPNNVQTGIMTQAPLGFDTSFGVANEPDEEQVEFLGSQPNRFQEGLGRLFEFFQKFSPIANIARGIESIRDRFDTRQAIKEDIARDTQGGPITTFRNVKQQAQDKIDDRGRGQIPSRTTSAPTRSFSKSYSDAKSAFTAGR